MNRQRKIRDESARLVASREWAMFDRRMGDVYLVEGYLLQVSAEWLLIHRTEDFHLDGYYLIRAGDITRIRRDGAYWDYAYDGRYRLTSAARKNSGGTTLQSHAYVYDAGDNLVSKTVAGTTAVFGYNTANELTTQTV